MIGAAAVADPRGAAYGLLLVAGIVAGFFIWSRLAHRDTRLLPIYFGALAGALIGAKIVYLAAEGWLHWHDPDRWVILATGKSITGALLGGYAGVEIVKRVIGYRAPTGDWFAVVAPVSLMIGRIGCVLHGCCLGRACAPTWWTVADANGTPRWPSAQAEFVFNALALVAVLVLRRQRRLTGQHFHLYLIAYGLFRFGHEFLRETPRVLGPISGYQLAALAVAGLGVAGFLRRRSLAGRAMARVEPAAGGEGSGTM